MDELNRLLHRNALMIANTGITSRAPDVAFVATSLDNIGIAAREAMGDRTPFFGPIEMSFLWVIERPGRQYDTATREKIRWNAPKFPMLKKSLNGMLNRLHAACTEVVYAHPALIVTMHTGRRFAPLGDRPRYEVAIWQV